MHNLHLLEPENTTEDSNLWTAMMNTDTDSSILSETFVRTSTLSTFPLEISEPLPQPPSKELRESR